MTLDDLKSLLRSHADRHFRLALPDGSAVPVSFHVTEVGHVKKVFLDCGGTRRESECCLLQVWVGEDYDHRIETGKMAAILDKAAAIVSEGSLPVEIEYEDRVISQYVISGHQLLEDSVVLALEHKHTECLAPELCGLPALPAAGRVKSAASSPCCGPSGCC